MNEPYELVFITLSVNIRITSKMIITGFYPLARKQIDMCWQELKMLV